MSVCDNLVSHEANIPLGHASETIKYKRVYGINFYVLDPKVDIVNEAISYRKILRNLTILFIMFCIKGVYEC